MYRRCGFRYEKKLHTAGVARIAGIDEAGRGALAGPVIAAAAILPEKFRHPKLNDSKQLSPELREKIYVDLTSNTEVFWAIGVVDHIEIDRINILRATHKAMWAAIGALVAPPDHVLIDGLPVFPFPFPQTAIVDGDCCSLSIAAASVIAKVTRDRMMRDFYLSISAAARMAKNSPAVFCAATVTKFSTAISAAGAAAKSISSAAIATPSFLSRSKLGGARTLAGP